MRANLLKKIENYNRKKNTFQRPHSNERICVKTYHNTSATRPSEYFMRQAWFQWPVLL